MNIGLIRMSYTPYGGAEVFLSRFIKKLVDEGHECHIFAAEWEACDNKNIFIHTIWSLKWPSFMKVSSFAIGSYFALKKAPMSVILSFEKTLYHDVYRAGDGCHREWLEQRKKSVSPLRYFTIILNPFHLVLLFLEKRLFKRRNLKAIIANSRMVKENIVKHYNVSENRIHVIYNGVDPRFFDHSDLNELRTKQRETLGIDDETYLLLFAGSGFERKGLLYLIEAVAKLKERNINVKLMVVGKGKTEKYKNASARYNVNDNILFLGPQKDIKGYYAACDLFVLPTLYDPFSNATLEAMACGKPVVTSRFNGASEVVKKEEMGSLIEEPKDPDEIARKIEEALLNHKKNAYKYKKGNFAEKYSIEKTVKEYLQILQSI